MSTAAEKAQGRQAQKSRDTRDRILDAAVSLINESGFCAATSTRIAGRSGVSPGGLRHHFANRDDVLYAVLAEAHEGFNQVMRTAELRRGPMSERVSLFIDMMWGHYRSDLFLAAIEILLGLRSDSDIALMLRWTDEQKGAYLHTMREFFCYADLSDEELHEALVYAHCFLTGLAIEQLLEPNMPQVERYLKRVKLTLVMMLSGD